MRAKNAGLGILQESTMDRCGDRDDGNTLRVTNLSEDVTDDDLWDLFGRFGRIS
jgi:translation initiation factor 3 subunit G